MQLISDWFRRNFSDPQAVFLTLVLVIGFTVVITMGRMLAPVLASIVIAYLLEGLVRVLEARGAPRRPTVVLVFLAFMAFGMLVLFGVIPLVWNQAIELMRELPNYVNRGQAMLMRLPEHYAVITEDQVREVIQALRSQVADQGQRILSLSLSSIPGIITIVVYLVLAPVLVFFFLMDKRRILKWVCQFLPKERHLAGTVWTEVDMQIGNYVRGKFWEILIVGVATMLVFVVMGLKFAVLLGLLVGLSVLVPYIGAAVVTVPVAIIGYFQWGADSQFLWLMVAYGIVQALDGNVLVPLLFSEVVNLHPVAIIVAVLVFGGIWGFWGVFFAIPLATLVNAILSAWPRRPREADNTGAEPTAE